MDGATATLVGKRILLGVTGGIAAYKAPELVRQLRRAGAEVQVVLTAGARAFVTPTALQAVSGQPVRDDLWDAGAEAAMGHIELARWADLLLVAPATANLLSAFASGRATDLLSTLYLATAARVVLAPAMNQAMWRHKATQRNLAQLLADGVHCIGPDSGDQACGDVGMGRMSQPEQIVQALSALTLAVPTAGLDQDLKGRRVLITAGPTQEALDPVRFLSNHSSGKQGYALAAAAAERGAEVTLVSGPVHLPAPPGVTRISVGSAVEMYESVMANVAMQDVVIGVAAVADYRPASVAAQKMKKPTGSGSPTRAPTLTLELVQNPDIIAAVAASKPRPFVVGFAAETEDALAHARAKRLQKGLDMIVVNDVSRQDIGFGADHNAATIITATDDQALPRQPKAALAHAILAAVAARLPGGPARQPAVSPSTCQTAHGSPSQS